MFRKDVLLAQYYFEKKCLLIHGWYMKLNTDQFHMQTTVIISFFVLKCFHNLVVIVHLLEKVLVVKPKKQFELKYAGGVHG